MRLGLEAAPLLHVLIVYPARPSACLFACLFACPFTCPSAVSLRASNAADNPVEERPFKGRVMRPQTEPAFRPCVPFWDHPPRFVTHLTDERRPNAPTSRRCR